MNTVRTVSCHGSYPTHGTLRRAGGRPHVPLSTAGLPPQTASRARAALPDGRIGVGTPRPRPLQRGQPTCPRRPAPPASPRARREGGLHPEAPVTVSPRGPGGGAQGRAGGGGDVGRARARGRGFHYETSDPVSVAALSASPRPALWAADSARRPLRSLPLAGSP